MATYSVDDANSNQITTGLSEATHPPIKRDADGRSYAGEGMHSHTIPTRDGRVVFMTDGHHEGTEIYWSEHVKKFITIHWDYSGDDRVQTADRLLLVRGASVEEYQDVLVACDLDVTEGMMFLEADPGSSVPELIPADGCTVEILWDSEWENKAV